MDSFESLVLSRLTRVLSKAWCLESSRGEWTPDCPSLNQCAPTAMLVQDFLGGDLLRCPVTQGGGHFWNRLSTGEEIDLTRDQFACSGHHPLWDQAIVYQRSALDASPDTSARYKILAERLEKYYPNVVEEEAKAYKP